MKECDERAELFQGVSEILVSSWRILQSPMPNEHFAEVTWNIK